MVVAAMAVAFPAAVFFPTRSDIPDRSPEILAAFSSLASASFLSSSILASVFY